jgi:hypothetical protein
MNLTGLLRANLDLARSRKMLEDLKSEQARLLEKFTLLAIEIGQSPTAELLSESQRVISRLAVISGELQALEKNCGDQQSVFDAAVDACSLEDIKRFLKVKQVHASLVQGINIFDESIFSSELDRFTADHPDLSLDSVVRDSSVTADAERLNKPLAEALLGLRSYMRDLYLDL